MALRGDIQVGAMSAVLATACVVVEESSSSAEGPSLQDSGFDDLDASGTSGDGTTFGDPDDGDPDSDGSGTTTGGPTRVPNVECSDNLLEDPGFEVPPPHPSWTEDAPVFGTVLCDAECSPDDGAYPYAGEGWAWFGGHEQEETASLSQAVVLDGTVATLGFYFSVNRATSSGTFSVFVDDDEIFSIADTRVADYDYQEFDVSAFADGNEHELRFVAEFDGSGSTNFFVDDVSLVTCAPVSAGDRTPPPDGATGDATEGATGGGTEATGGGTEATDGGTEATGSGTEATDGATESATAATDGS